MCPQKRREFESVPTAQAVRRKRVGRGRQEKDAEGDRAGRAAGRRAAAETAWLEEPGAAEGTGRGWRGAVRPGTEAPRDVSEDAQR